MSRVDLVVSMLGHVSPIRLTSQATRPFNRTVEFSSMKARRFRTSTRDS